VVLLSLRQSHQIVWQSLAVVVSLDHCLQFEKKTIISVQITLPRAQVLRKIPRRHGKQRRYQAERDQNDQAPADPPKPSRPNKCELCDLGLQMFTRQLRQPTPHCRNSLAGSLHCLGIDVPCGNYVDAPRDPSRKLKNVLRLW
jgi:hypothetical protein